jgi:hypothetical protein
LPTHLRLGLPSDLFPSGFPTNILYAFFVSSPPFCPENGSEIETVPNASEFHDSTLDIRDNDIALGFCFWRTYILKRDWRLTYESLVAKNPG